MTQTLLIFLGLVIILVLVWPKSRYGVVKVCKSALDQTLKKSKNKKKIIELLEQGELSNSEIREALKVSRRSVVRYMDQLEKEDRVEQVGDIGRGVTYRLK